jgi:hypothetical protein
MPVPRFADSTRADSMATRMRAIRRHRFLEWMRPRPGMRILDIGGQQSTWTDLDVPCRVTVVNLSGPDRIGPCLWVQGNALRLPFADSSFDVVFSNSVIEHVGDYRQQERFAHEVQRVGSRYWIQAPNRRFPIEPHFLFPWFQYLPVGLRVLVGKHWPFSWSKHFRESQHAIEAHARTIRLPTPEELLCMFPGGMLHRELLYGLTKSITIASR